MADITTLARLLNGALRNVDLQSNTPVVLSIKIGGGSNTELTKAILDKLILINTAADSDGTFDTRYTKKVDLASTASGKGASLVGIQDSGNYFTGTTVEAALQELGTAVGTGSASGISYSNSTSGLSATNVQTAIDEVEGRVDATEIVANAAIPLTQKGANSGVATLDSGGKVPVSQLPNSVMEFQGNWNASTNSPSLADATGNIGDVYRVNVAGTQNLGSGSQTFIVGDWVVYGAGGIWQKAHSGADAVLSVNGFAGVVVLTTSDIAQGTNLYYTASQARTDVLASSITNGDTTHAPTGNAVFAALALKQAASANLDEADTFFGVSNLTGAQSNTLSDGSNADALHVHSKLVKSMVAGAAFAANTSFAVRMAINGETARRAYKADKLTSTSDLMYVVGIMLSTSALSAGQSGNVTMAGTHILGSSDTPFSSSDIGKPVFLTSAGAFSITPPSSSGDAITRIGIIEDTDRIFVQPSVVGVL